jgi:Tol biopolymer transport system component
VGQLGSDAVPGLPSVAFVSDRSGLPRLWVQDLPTPGAEPPAGHLSSSDDPVVAVSWSADGGWLAVAVATGGGVKTQVWVVRRTAGTPGCWPAGRSSTPSSGRGRAAGTGWS